MFAIGGDHSYGALMANGYEVVATHVTAAAGCCAAKDCCSKRPLRSESGVPDMAAAPPTRVSPLERRCSGNLEPFFSNP